MQVLRDPDLGDQAPVLAAVGRMQFEVATWRLEHEFGAPVELTADQLPGGPPHRRRLGAGAAADAGRQRAAPGRRHPPGAVRVALLAGAGGGRQPRAAPRTPGRRGHGRLRGCPAVPTGAGRPLSWTCHVRHRGFSRAAAMPSLASWVAAATRRMVSPKRTASTHGSCWPRQATSLVARTAKGAERHSRSARFRASSISESWGDDLPHQAHLPGPLGVDPLAQQQQLHGVLPADAARHAHRALDGRHAQADLGEAERGPVGGDHEVAGRRRA